MPHSISIIITTYNRPDALQLVLQSLHNQSRLPDEVIIADDGSTPETQELITRIQAQVDYPIRHVWQPDEGFRAAQIRNQAARKAHSDYLIFLDGDCVVRPDFVQQHGLLAEKGWFVAGNRVMLNNDLTHQIESQQPPSFCGISNAGSSSTRKAAVIALSASPAYRLAPYANWRRVDGKKQSVVTWAFGNKILTE